MVDDAGEEEWEVEEICNYRKPEGGGLEFVVKWKGGEETWEPFEHVAETEALDRYERLYGPVALGGLFVQADGKRKTGRGGRLCRRGIDASPFI